MGGAPSRSQAVAITGINVTPLVDITLVLLVIFMVTAKLIVSHRALPLDLPKASSGTELQEVFSVVLYAAGRSEVNGRALSTDDEVLPIARAAQQANRELRAVIAADSAVPHGRVMRLLDLLKQAGVARIGFAVVPPAAATALDTRDPSLVTP